MTPRDKARQLAELQAQLAALQTAITAINQVPTSNHCFNCLHSNKETFYCGMFEAVVPEEYRHQTGCPEFEDDIPF